jgi:hypothetical protein
VRSFAFALACLLLLNACAKQACPVPTLAAHSQAPALRHHRPPAPELQLCEKSLDRMLLKLSKNARYAYTADAIDSMGGVHMFYINTLSRRWAEVHVYDDLHACVESRGPAWRWRQPTVAEVASTPPPAHAAHLISPAAAAETRTGTVVSPRPVPEGCPIPLRCANSAGAVLQSFHWAPRHAVAADVTDSRGRRHRWYVDDETRIWVELRVYPSHRACLEAGGGDWHWAAAH